MAKSIKLLPLAFLILFLGSCSDNAIVSAGGSPSGGSGVGLTYSSAYGGDLSGIEIRRIGNDAIRFREFQDRAIINSLGFLEASGVKRERIEGITVETQGGDSSGFGTFRSMPSYGVWISVKDCDSSIFFRGSASGAIARPRDRAGCLKPPGA